MFRTIRKTGLVLALCMPGMALADLDNLTLDQAVDMALNNDPRIEDQQANVARAQALIERVAGEGGVRISANMYAGIAPQSGDGLFDNGTNTCPGGEDCTLRDDAYKFNEGFTITTGLTASLIKPLHTFGKLENYGRAADLNRAVSEAEVSVARGETYKTVHRAYYGYLAARDTRRMLEGVLRQISTHRDDIKKDAEEGLVSMSDLYAVDTGIGTLNRFIAKADSIEAIALDGLKTIIGVPIEQPIGIADSRLQPVTMPDGELDFFSGQALAERPEMRMAEQGLAAMRYFVAARKAESRPNLYAGVIGGGAYTPGRDRLRNPYIHQPLNNGFFAPVVGLQWEFNPGLVRANVSEAEADMQSVVAQARLAQQGIPFQVSEAYHQARGLRGQIEALDDARTAARRWMISSFMDYQAGLIDGNGMAEAVRANTETQAEYLQAVNDYNMAVTKLAVATGDYPQ